MQLNSHPMDKSNMAEISQKQTTWILDMPPRPEPLNDSYSQPGNQTFGYILTTKKPNIWIYTHHQENKHWGGENKIGNCLWVILGCFLPLLFHIFC